MPRNKPSGVSGFTDGSNCIVFRFFTVIQRKMARTFSTSFKQFRVKWCTKSVKVCWSWLATLIAIWSICPNESSGRSLLYNSSFESALAAFGGGGMLVEVAVVVVDDAIVSVAIELLVNIPIACFVLVSSRCFVVCCWFNLPVDCKSPSLFVVCSSASERNDDSNWFASVSMASNWSKSDPILR